MMEQRVTLRQRRDLSQIIDAALRIYGQNFSVLFRIAAVVIPMDIIANIVPTTIGNKTEAQLASNVLSLIGAVVTLVVGAAVIAALGDIDKGQAIDFGRAYDAAFLRIGTLVAANLRVLFHVTLFVLTIVGLPWAIQRFVRWLFVDLAVMLEGATAKDSLSMSAAAVEGSWWRTLGFQLVLVLLVALPIGIVVSLFLLAPPAVWGTAAGCLHALLLPLFVTGTTLLYFDLKTRKEEANASRDISTGVEETT